MKKFVCLLVGVATMATVAMAQTSVLSQNAVGYVKVTIDAGDLALVRYDFEQIDGSDAVLSTVIGDQLPAGANAFVWDRAAKSWSVASKGARGWAPDAVIARGDAIFLSVPAAAALPSYDVYLMGEVPGANNESDTTVIDNVEGDAIGFPYPAALELGAMDATTQAGTGASVFLWDQVAQSWASPITKGARGWSANPTIEPGQGFFIVTALGTPVDVTEVKPYEWP